MATTKTVGKKFPHVKGLAKKATKFGHRWVLTEPDSTGKSRSITVKILDTDDVTTFYAKVAEARRTLQARDTDERFQYLIDEYICMRQLSQSSEEQVRRYVGGFSFNAKKNKELVMDVMKKPTKKSTMNLKIGIIGRFFRWLIAKGEQVKDPTEGIVIKSSYNPRTRTATQEELKRLIERVKKFGDNEFLLFVLLLIHTGARTSSIVALKPENLDNSNHLHLYNVKTQKNYSYKIPITNEEILSLWKQNSKNGTLWSKDPKLQMIRLRELMYRMFPKDANGERLSPHSLRHTFASNAIQAGVPLEIVSKLLDHSSISITLNVYAKFSQAQIDDSMAKLEKYR